MDTNGLEDVISRLELSIQAGDMAWWEMELPSGVVFFGENKAHMIGRDPSDFIHYKNFTDLLHPDDYESAMQAMRDHLEGRTPTYHTIYRIQHKDGTYRLFFDRGKIVSKPESKTIKLTGIVVDVTDDVMLFEQFMKASKM